MLLLLLSSALAVNGVPQTRQRLALLARRVPQTGHILLGVEDFEIGFFIR
jgi:hypothetical protein